MKRFRTVIHECAVYVIPPRKMGFHEKLPPVLYSLVPEKIQGLHHCAQWKHCMKHLSGVHTHAFYQVDLFDIPRFFRAGELFTTQALTARERKGLEKISKHEQAG